MSRRLLAVSVCVLSMFILSASLEAATVVLNPTLFGSTREDVPTGFSAPFDSTTGATTMQVGMWSGSRLNPPAIAGPDWNGWVRFEIPDFGPFTEIVSATLTIDVKDNWPNASYPAGIRAYYMTDDTWTNTTITDTQAVTGTYVQNRAFTWSQAQPAGSGTGERSNDITSWLSLPGEGEGMLLSMKLDRDDANQRGNRGASGVTAYLTLETEVMPEPATLTGLALGLGALLARRRRST